jgi:hypothetical protein
MMTLATVGPIPGTSSSRSTAERKGAICVAIRSSIAAMSALIASTRPSILA